MVELKDLLSRLTPEERQQLLDAPPLDSTPLDAIKPRPRGRGPSPLSFSQQRLWFLDQLAPGNPVYNMPCRLRLEGTLDVPSLSRALEEIVRRHEILRTVFPASGEEPVQRVLPSVRLDLDPVPLDHLPSGDREAEVERLFAEEGMRPFDLGRGPLIRSRLLRLGDSNHVLILNIHHIAGDGWSYRVLLDELSRLYGAYVSGSPSPLPDLPIQYADYAAWQREWMSGDLLQSHLAYWRQKLEGARVLELPGDFPRPAIQTFRGDWTTRMLPVPLAEKVKGLARASGATLFMVVMAAVQAFLARYAGQTDVIIGTPVAGRNRLETEGLIGFFVNMLVMRTDLGGSPSFREVVERAKKVALEAYAHQDAPFEAIVNALHPERDTSRTPLFQVSLSLQNLVDEDFRFPGLRGRIEIPGQRVSRFDLTLEVRETTQGLKVGAEYSTELFRAGTIDRLLRHFETFLASATDNPERRLGDLSLLDQAERRKVLVFWNDTRTAYPETAIHRLVEEQALLAPDAVAVECESESLTYGALNRLANRLARRLREEGVGPDTLVGVSAEKSLGVAIALLAVLKAGGAYVPLDPDYPADRLAFMVSDTRTPVVVTSGEAGGDKLRGCPAKLIRLEPEFLDDSPGAPGADNLDLEVDPRNLAYVIYTSGSTGRPKGVAVPHRAVVRLVKGANYAELGKDEVFLAFAPVSFDASTLEFWGPLANGGKVVVMPRGPSSLDRLGEVLKSAHITTLFLTTALYNLMVERELDSLSGLRQLLFGGELASLDHVRRGVAGLEACRVTHVYGPTENTTFTTYKHLSEPDRLVEPLPIGRPLSNTTVYVLDSYLEPVPLGVPGELYTGGDGLARGYHDRPELTAERFLPDPFSGEPGARMYRTGDLARRNLEGDIEFLSRLDNQVKVRGFRVEPGEIEIALERFPGLADAAVVAKDDVQGGKRLVAYVVPASGGEDLTSRLRQHLRESLPEYMVPAVIVTLEGLPLTATGKVDRRALLNLDDPGGDSGSGRGAYVAPRNAREETIAGIWARILGLDRVGVEDDFFELGGHSLLATRVISAIRQAFGIELPLLALFEHPTVSRLTLQVEEALLARTDPDLLGQLLKGMEAGRE